jgi:hypothetical protein
MRRTGVARPVRNLGIAALSVALSAFAALSCAPAQAAEHRVVIPCQTATGNFAVVKPVDPQTLFCDRAWMSAAKRVGCPPRFARYAPTCYMPPAGNGIILYGDDREVDFGWCSRTQAGALACERSSPALRAP